MVPNYNVELSVRPDLITKLVPEHAKPALLEQGIDVNNFVPIEVRSLTTLGD
jgi:glycogen synthase kinase 3 beta